MYFAKLLWTALVTQKAVTLAFKHLPDSNEPNIRCYTNFGPHRPAQNPTTTTRVKLQDPSTITTTVTKTKTSTATSTVTETFTKISTIKTASTVAAPKNFVAVQTTLPQGTYNGKDGSDPVGASRKSRAARLPIIKGERGNFLQGVTCLQLQDSKPKTTTTTVTKTIVVSTTELETIKKTTTSTLTDYTTTLYAACATHNFVNYLRSPQYPFIGGGGGQSSVDSTNAKSAYDCCVDALSGPHLAAWFNYAPYLQSNQCTIGLTDHCANPASDPSTLLYGPVSYPAQVWGNGYCGQIVSVEAAFGTSSSNPATASSVSSIVASTPTRCAVQGNAHKHHC